MNWKFWKLITCNHDWHEEESGDLELTGHSLAAGSIIGKWIKYRCSKCNFTKEKKELI